MKFWQSFKLAQNGENYLTRQGLNLPWFGIYLHHIDNPDPGDHLHDHPWTFWSLILRGGYEETYSGIVKSFPQRYTWKAPDLYWRYWGRGSIHKIDRNHAHRIDAAIPGTKTLVVRGPKIAPWGFYTDKGFIDADEYRDESRALTKEEK